MRPQIVPFEPRHIEAAAALLARRHAADREPEPRLPALYASMSGTRPLLDALAPHATGVAVLDDGRLIGYLLGTPDHDWGGRACLVPMEGHAASAPDAADVYGEMYAAAAPGWIDAGYFWHTINVPAGDEAVAAAFNGLGFGQMLAFGLRDVEPLERVTAGVRISRAGPQEIEAVEALFQGLSRYNSMPPLFRPYVPREPHLAQREQTLQRMADESWSYWLAYKGDEPVAVMALTPPEPTELMISPERSVYLWVAYVKPEGRASGLGSALLQNGLAWAREQGQEFCTVGWFTANLSGARFWTARGYRPAMYRLERKLDERISWAKADG